MGLTYAQCKALGIAHLFPVSAGKNPIPAIARPAVSAAPDDGMNKLERAFWERLREAERKLLFRRVYEHPIKLRVIGNRWYIPDFVSEDCCDCVNIWETKGFMREDAELKLIAAAERFPCFRWVLVKQVRRRWECRHVTGAGISKEVFTPDWLR